MSASEGRSGRGAASAQSGRSCVPPGLPVPNWPVDAGTLPRRKKGTSGAPRPILRKLVDSGDHRRGELLSTMKAGPFLVDLALPPFLRPGDNLLLPVEVRNQSEQTHAFRVTMRTPGMLWSYCAKAGPGDRMWMDFPCVAGDSGVLEAGLELLCEGADPEQRQISVPILVEEYPEETPTTEDIWRSSRPDWSVPVDEGLRVERRYQALDGQDLPRSHERVCLPMGSLLRVRLELTSHSKNAVLLVETPPAGLEIQEILAPESPEGAVPDWRFEVRPRHVEIQADTLSEGGLVFLYTVRARLPGTFLAPPTRVEQLGCPEVRGRTGWEAVEVETPPEARWPTGGPELDACITWGANQLDPGCSDDHLSYFMGVDGQRRRGWVEPDGSIRETSSLDHRERQFLQYAWLGLLVPPALVAHSSSVALNCVVEWQGERLLARPRRRKWKDKHLKCSVLPAIVRLREGIARRVRARLREFGLSPANAQSP